MLQKHVESYRHKHNWKRKKSYNTYVKNIVLVCTNEKYCGDSQMLAKKTFHYSTKKRRKDSFVAALPCKNNGRAIFLK